ncbi:MAG: GTP-binding protein TypA [Omnitrophica bacterium RIFCSPHIGHO2_02_FULL_51_18]|nr:MAG: GTP-binding protein TypA [Omnitrophica bacterium RIFCSPHIGHO2_02_FULL_51_18]
MITQQKIRNVAIIAHVDHGKTTLVDGILRQMHVHRNIEEMGECIMDSMDLEKERGITIRAKNASVVYKGIKINIVDTPGHADFGGEVERTLKMVDGALLLVDAKDGPMPQTRFVLRKALELGHKVIVVINKVDRADSQIEEVVNRTFDLFCDLNANEEQLDFPIVYTAATQGTATLDMAKPAKNINALLDVILEKIPPPKVVLKGPLQILVLALSQDSYKGKMGIGKVTGGMIRKNDIAMLVRRDKSRVTAKITNILVYQGLERAEVESAEAGEIVAVGGFENIGIGDTITDTANPMPLEPPVIDEPTVQMTFGVNTSPFSGREGKYVTSRVLRDRLFKELETNVSLRVTETDSPDTFLVAGRGELHLGILIETMRREGYELQVSQPEVILHEKNGVKYEPFEFLIVDVPSEYQGSVIEEIGKRRGLLKNMIQAPLPAGQAGTGELHLEYQIPTRGVIGLKGVFMTKTHGTAIVHHVFDEYQPMVTEKIESAPHGSLVASEPGVSTSYGLNNAQGRGALFIGSGVEIYQGMIIGENSRDEDLDLSPCKSKKLTNMRSSGSDDAIVLTPPKELPLELAIEYIAPDELVEVTPKSIRLRKRVLDPLQRKRLRRQEE